MKKDVGDIYFNEIQAAIIKAGGGDEGSINVGAAGLSCIAVAAVLVGTLPRKLSKAMVKKITLEFGSLVAATRLDVEAARKEGISFDPVELQ